MKIVKLNLIFYFILFILLTIDSVISIERNSNKIDESTNLKETELKNDQNNDVTESPVDTLIAITRTPLELIHRVLTANETSKHAKELSDIIGYNLKKIVKKFFKIANEALDNLNTINNAGLVSVIVQFASFMTKVQNYVSPSEWQETLLSLNIPNNLRLPLNLRSHQNAHHEQIFDINDYL